MIIVINGTWAIKSVRGTLGERWGESRARKRRGFGGCISFTPLVYNICRESANWQSDRLPWTYKWNPGLSGMPLEGSTFHFNPPFFLSFPPPSPHPTTWHTHTHTCKIRLRKSKKGTCIRPQLGWSKPLTKAWPCPQSHQTSPDRTCWQSSQLPETRENRETLGRDVEYTQKSQMEILERKKCNNWNKKTEWMGSIA